MNIQKKGIAGCKKRQQGDAPCLIGFRAVALVTTIYVAKTEALISCSVTPIFVFAYAKRLFFYYTAHIHTMIFFFFADLKNVQLKSAFVFSSPVQSTGRAIVVTLASALTLALPFCHATFKFCLSRSLHLGNHSSESIHTQTIGT